MAERRTGRLTTRERDRIVANYQRHFAQDHGWGGRSYQENQAAHRLAHGGTANGPGVWHLSHAEDAERADFRDTARGAVVTGHGTEPTQVGPKPTVTVQTAAHRALGSGGVVVLYDATAGLPPVATAWKLADGGVWTTADLGQAQALLDAVIARD